MCQYGKNSAKLTSIAQDLVSLALAMTLRQLAGSASVISLLSSLGHCMPHSFVLCHETALAQVNISNDSAIPPRFVSDVPATIAWDKDDFLEETRSAQRQLT